MKAKSIRAFIGAKILKYPGAFYREIGFEEVRLDAKMSYFKVNESLGFYLQDAYIKDWVDNSMIFLEMDNLDDFRETLLAKNLDKKYEIVRVSAIKNEAWGQEFFMHDPSGIPLAFGRFKN